MKKILLAFLIIVLVIGLSGLGIKFLRKPGINQETNKTTPKPKVENVNQLSLEKRPYIIVEPKSETRPTDYGHWVTITIDKASNYKSVEYDVEYQAGNLIQGFTHRVDFSKEKLPVAKEGFFGSESKGKYKYDENVKSGSILFKFFKDATNYDALKNYFNLQNMAEQKGFFTSNDSKANLQIGANDLNANDYVVVASTLGLPASITGKALAEPYGFYTTRAVKLKNATLSIKSKEDLTKAKILGWDGKQWQEYKISIKEETASTIVNQFGTYILVSD